MSGCSVYADVQKLRLRSRECTQKTEGPGSLRTPVQDAYCGDCSVLLSLSPACGFGHSLPRIPPFCLYPGREGRSSSPSRHYAGRGSPLAHRLPGSRGGRRALAPQTSGVWARSAASWREGPGAATLTPGGPHYPQPPDGAPCQGPFQGRIP